MSAVDDLETQIAAVNWLGQDRQVTGPMIRDLFLASTNLVAGVSTGLQALAGSVAQVPTIGGVGAFVTGVATTLAITTATIPAAITYLRTAGYANPGDGGGALIMRSATGSTNPATWTDPSGAVFELVLERAVTFRQLGGTAATISGKANSQTVTGADSAAAINAAIAFACWASGNDGSRGVTVTGEGLTYIANSPTINNAAGSNANAAGIIVENFALTAQTDAAFQPDAIQPDGYGLINWTSGSGIRFRHIYIDCGGLRGLSINGFYSTRPGFARLDYVFIRRWTGANGNGFVFAGGSFTCYDCVAAQWATGSDPGVYDPTMRSGYGYKVKEYPNGTPGGGVNLICCQGNFGLAPLYVHPNAANVVLVSCVLLNGASTGSTPVPNVAGAAIYGNNVRFTDLQLNSCGLFFYGTLSTGSLAFTTQPAPGSSIRLNGTPVSFVTGSPSGNQVQLGVNLAVTLANLQAFAAASTDANIVKATYTVSGSSLAIKATASFGAGNGNNFTFSADANSGATCVGGAVAAFAAQPAAGSVLNIAGTAVTFVSGAPVGNQVQIGADLPTTLANLAAFANASTDPRLALAASYNAYPSLLVSQGVNDFTLAAGTNAVTKFAVVDGAGSIGFSAQPDAGAVVTLNGTVVTFVAGSPGAKQVAIGATVAATVANLAAFANASTDANISKGTFTASTLFVASASATFTMAAGPGSNATIGATLGGGSNSIDTLINGISMTSTFPTSTFPAAINLITEVPSTSLKNFKPTKGQRLSSGQMSINLATLGAGSYAGVSATDIGIANTWPGEVSWASSGLLQFGGISLIGGGLSTNGYPIDLGGGVIKNALKPGKTLQPSASPYTLLNSDSGTVLYINQGVGSFTILAPNTLFGQPNAQGEFEVAMTPAGSGTVSVNANAGASMNGTAGGSFQLVNNRRNLLTVGRNADGVSAECFT